jgi:hypothetical protein
MRTARALLFLSTLIVVPRVVAADASPCGPPPSALAQFDDAPDLVRVRVVEGSTQGRTGSVTYKFVVVATLRGSTAVGVTLDGDSGGPCARHLVEGAQYVFPLGTAHDVGEGRVNAGTMEPRPTSLALQIALAKTPLGDARARVAVVVRAATARNASAQDRASLIAYLGVSPEVVKVLTRAERRRLDAAFAKTMETDPSLGDMWTLASRPAHAVDLSTPETARRSLYALVLHGDKEGFKRATTRRLLDRHAADFDAWWETWRDLAGRHAFDGVAVTLEGNEYKFDEGPR